MTADQIQQCKDKLLLIQQKHQELEEAFAEDDTLAIPEQTSTGRLSLMESMESQKNLLKESRGREMLAEKSKEDYAESKQATSETASTVKKR